MSKVRVAGYTISLDGFGAGPGQSLDEPLGAGGRALHGWLVGTPTFRRMVLHEEVPAPAGAAPGAGVDEAFAARSFREVGAWIMGRNMFGPVRGPWPDESWRGWWGEEPPYHVPVYVLTHHARPPLRMAGGTTFHFVTGGPLEALARAREAAGGKDVRVGGGAATIRAYLQAGLIDELHLAVSPVLLGSGEPLLAGIDLVRLGYRCTERAASEQALHVVLGR